MKKNKIWLAAVMAVVLSLVMAVSASAATQVADDFATAPPNTTATVDIFANDADYNPDYFGSGSPNLVVVFSTCNWFGGGSVSYDAGPSAGDVNVCSSVVYNQANGDQLTETFTVTTESSGDSESPVITVDYPVDGGTVSSSTVTLDYTATDNVGVTSCSPADGTVVTLVQGDNPITVTCQDAANNVGSKTVHVNYVPPDAQQPVVTITSPANNSSTTSSSAVVQFTATDNVGVTSCDRVSGDSVALSPGPNLITVNCQDAIGNVGSASVNVTYDAPLTLTVSPGTGYEGDPGDPTTSYIVFQVSLNRPTNQDVDIGYWALPSSASCIDFACNILLPKVKTIPAGQTTTQIKIAIKNDNRTEGLEKMILLYLSCDVPTAGYVYGTIVDDETAPPPNQN